MKCPPETHLPGGILSGHVSTALSMERSSMTIQTFVGFCDRVSDWVGQKFAWVAVPVAVSDLVRGYFQKSVSTTRIMWALDTATLFICHSFHDGGRLRSSAQRPRQHRYDLHVSFPAGGRPALMWQVTSCCSSPIFLSFSMPGRIWRLNPCRWETRPSPECRSSFR